MNYINKQCNITFEKETVAETTSRLKAINQMKKLQKQDQSSRYYVSNRYCGNWNRMYMRCNVIKRF